MDVVLKHLERPIVSQKIMLSREETQGKKVCEWTIEKRSGAKDNWEGVRRVD